MVCRMSARQRRCAFNRDERTTRLNRDEHSPKDLVISGKSSGFQRCADCEFAVPLPLRHHDLRTILQRLRQTRGLDLLPPSQVRDRARKFHASRVVIGTRDRMGSPDRRSTFHNPRAALRCGCAVSIRSSKGPEIRFWYFVTMACAQVQGFCESPYQPHGQGCTQLDMFFM